MYNTHFRKFSTCDSFRSDGSHIILYRSYSLLQLRPQTEKVMWLRDCHSCACAWVRASVSHRKPSVWAASMLWTACCDFGVDVGLVHATNTTKFSWQTGCYFHSMNTDWTGDIVFTWTRFLPYVTIDYSRGAQPFWAKGCSVLYKIWIQNYELNFLESSITLFLSN